VKGRTEQFSGQSMMMVLKTNKSPDEILQEEFLQERAAVLGRAGDSVSRALEKLRGIEHRLEECLGRLKDMEKKNNRNPAGSSCAGDLRRHMVLDINREINRFNRTREYALLRYYYLIVTREAMGMRRHHWVEQQYRVPPRKKHLQDDP
jgi:hypothetical protein